MSRTTASTPKRAGSSATSLSVADVRTGLDSTSLKQAMLDHLHYSLGRLPAVATPANDYRALALAIRDRLQQRWIRTSETYVERGRQLACYLSAEFLLGPHLGNNLLNLGLEQAAREALTALGQDLDAILDCEPEPGLGNGGLGRLAACYLDSLATLQYPAIGYGIRYEFGIFAQEIRDGWQTERTDKWLSGGNPWEIAKPDIARMSILNCARGGKFSSDRAIEEYARAIWGLQSVPIQV
ncbi:glycogen/starch/alpha-glucan phosphorylase [Thiocystis minor]|uniref:glycogen/starch/alpha-glucan phosphorylase n=1 Tax=Thiocystis minor TaxID=61597 RepID=UPI00191395B0